MEVSFKGGLGRPFFLEGGCPVLRDVDRATLNDLSDKANNRDRTSSITGLLMSAALMSA